MSEDRGYITHPLHQRRHRSPGAENQFFDLVVANLHPLAHPIMRRGQTTLYRPPSWSTRFTYASSLGSTKKIGGAGAIFPLLLIEPCEEI
jgi:hypothetical protein